MASVDRSLVANLPMFAGLAPAEQDELLREARSVRYPKGSAVFDQGAEADHFYLLLHGHLRVEKITPQGQQSVVRYVSAGARPANIGRFATSERSTEAIDILVPGSRGGYPRPKQASTAWHPLSAGFGAEIALAQHRPDQAAISDAPGAR